MGLTKTQSRILTKSSRNRGISEAGATHPALPAVILLVSFAVFMAAIAPLDFTTIFHRYFPVHAQAVPHQEAAVWVNKTAGVYYCADSIMFGKTKGQYMKQVDALDRGYQPALGTYCTGPAWNLHSHFNKPAPASSPAPAPKSATAGNPFENPSSRPGAPNTTPALPTGSR